ncbi:YitT family protein [Metabacillus litoralis]|uniref:YitT family protein n=1 Tax=Metabacillus litoralis TaxID=152268 RepID=A0A5C6W549_9BACI|nr:YitT family protein [Metabacillus litoralis]TXC93076.1 YitT family protein [Metabacillus litoralis]
MSTIKKLLFVLLGLVITSLGIKILSNSLLTFGGTAGIATILTYVTNISWGVLFFIVNLPFFFISIQELGKWFTISSLLSITGISFIREGLDLWIPAFDINIILATVIAGLLIGFGVTFVLNNGSSLGGIHILGLYIDKKFGLNRGIVLFVCDSLIILFAVAIVGWYKGLLSIFCIFIASTIIGRYKKSPIKEMERDQEEHYLRQNVH